MSNFGVFPPPPPASSPPPVVTPPGVQVPRGVLVGMGVALAVLVVVAVALVSHDAGRRDANPVGVVATTVAVAPLDTSSNPTQSPVASEPVKSQDEWLMETWPDLDEDTRVSLCLGYLNDPDGFVDDALVAFAGEASTVEVTRAGAEAVYGTKCGEWLDDPEFNALDRAMFRQVWESNPVETRAEVCVAFRADPFGSTERVYASVGGDAMSAADAREMYGELCP